MDVESLPVDGALREVRDDDADALTALIGGVYAEYPGCVLDRDGVDSDLPAMATYVADLGGRFWVVEQPDGRLVACIGYVPAEVAGEPGVELKRLYVDAVVRGCGLGRRLVAHIEEAALHLDRPVVELWSDTRFHAGHRLYARLGYVRQAESRDLHDPSHSTEYRYLKRVAV